MISNQKLQPSVTFFLRRKRKEHHWAKERQCMNLWAFIPLSKIFYSSSFNKMKLHSNYLRNNFCMDCIIRISSIYAEFALFKSLWNRPIDYSEITPELQYWSALANCSLTNKAFLLLCHDQDSTETPEPQFLTSDWMFAGKYIFVYIKNNHSSELSSLQQQSTWTCSTEIYMLFRTIACFIL